MEISAFGLGVTLKGLAGANQCTTIASFDHGFRVNVKVIESSVRVLAVPHGRPPGRSEAQVNRPRVSQGCASTPLSYRTLTEALSRCTSSSLCKSSEPASRAQFIWRERIGSL